MSVSQSVSQVIVVESLQHLSQAIAALKDRDGLHYCASIIRADINLNRAQWALGNDEATTGAAISLARQSFYSYAFHAFKKTAPEQQIAQNRFASTYVLDDSEFERSIAKALAHVCSVLEGTSSACANILLAPARLRMNALHEALEIVLDSLRAGKGMDFAEAVAEADDINASITDITLPFDNTIIGRCDNYRQLVKALRETNSLFWDKIYCVLPKDQRSSKEKLGRTRRILHPYILSPRDSVVEAIAIRLDEQAKLIQSLASQL